MRFFTPGEGRNVVPLKTGFPSFRNKYRPLPAAKNTAHCTEKRIQKYPVPSRCPSLLRKIHLHADAVDTQWGKSVRAGGCYYGGAYNLFAMYH